MNTKQPPKVLSSLFPNRTSQIVVEILFLLAAGVFAAIAHHMIKFPIGLPGKQGLIFIFVLVSALQFSSIPLASTIMSVGSALFFFWSADFHIDPMKPFLLLFVGVLIDLSNSVIQRYKLSIWFLPCFVAIAWATIPAIRFILVMFNPIPFNSLKAGIWFPLFTHFAFALVGGIAAIGLIKILKK